MYQRKAPYLEVEDEEPENFGVNWDGMDQVDVHMPTRTHVLLVVLVVSMKPMNIMPQRWREMYTPMT